MCRNTEKNISNLARQSVEEVFRALRYDRQKKIAKLFTRAVARQWTKTEKELHAQVQGLAEARGEKVPSLRSTPIGKKVIHPENIDALVTLSNYMTAEEIAAIEGLFRIAGQDMRAIFARWLDTSYQDGLDMAYDWMRDGHPSERRSRLSKQDPERFAQIPPIYTRAVDSEFYRSFYDDALETITSKVSRYFKGEAFAVMADGILDGLEWSEIAIEMRRSIGQGALWHWRRLIRTEMAAAYDRSMAERYDQAGVEYVKRSLAVGACPICISQRGIYQLGYQPRIPSDSHPNCRCTYIPYWNLPAGSEVRGFDRSGI